VGAMGPQLLSGTSSGGMAACMKAENSVQRGRAGGSWAGRRHCCCRSRRNLHIYIQTLHTHTCTRRDIDIYTNIYTLVVTPHHITSHHVTSHHITSHTFDHITQPMHASPGKGRDVQYGLQNAVDETSIARVD
jgi:hypothetical protein